MKNENLGLMAGLSTLSGIMALWLNHWLTGAVLAGIGITFAILLGLSKRSKRPLGEKR